MIIARIMGGLGNQIACYAFGRSCARRLGVPLKLDTTAYRDYRLHEYCLDRFTLEATQASEQEVEEAKRNGVLAERTVLFDANVLDYLRDGLYLDGYWGDCRYAQEALPELRPTFSIREPLQGLDAEVLQRIRSTVSVSLHIRRGDYVTNPHCVVLPMAYYEDAAGEVLRRVPKAHFFVFSDDPDWVEANLKLQGPCTFVRHNGPERNAQDLELMRACQHHILANSSFSLWAARLDPKPGGLVVAPQHYFRPDDDDMIKTFGAVAQPVWPPEWIVMPVRIPGAAPDPDAYLGIAGGDSWRRPIRIGVWNYYEELTTDGFIFKNANASIGHNLLKPWGDLHAYGQEHGLQFFTLDQVKGPEELDVVLFQDRPRLDNPLVGKILDSPVLKYLCLWETEVIKPDNWDPAFHEVCDRIFTWNDDLVDHGRYLKLNSAMEPFSPYDFEVLKTAYEQRKLCTMIAGAKLVRHPNELYSERIQAIRWFEAHAPADFDLYGVGWNPKDFPSYRGSVGDKLAALSRYRFAICYENARNYPGYITEKILDCFRAGVVPVYLGAPNVEAWIPAGCFIDLNDFQGYHQLYDFLSGMGSEEYGGYLDRIREFLASSKSYPFSTECFITTLTGCIARDVKQRRGEAPQVTVAIPAFNYGKYIGTTLESALVQEVEGLEVLVLDNASSDATPDVVSRFAADPRVRYMRNTRNIGSFFNWQNILKIASGRYVAILSADDFFLPGHLARMVQAMNEEPRLALAYCPCVWVDADSKPMYVLNHPGHPAQDYRGGRNEMADLLRFDCYITPSAALIRRTVLDAVGSIDALLAGAGDWDLWIRIAEYAPDFAFFKEPKVCYRVHAGQDTNTQVASANILVDHIRILWNALERGSLPRFQERADEVAAALWGKFRLYPKDLVSHLEPHLRELERLIKSGEPADYGMLRRKAEGLVDRQKSGGSRWTAAARDSSKPWDSRHLATVRQIVHLRKLSTRRNDVRAGAEAERLRQSLGKVYFPLLVMHKLSRPWENLKRSIEKRRSKRRAAPTMSPAGTPAASSSAAAVARGGRRPVVPPPCPLEAFLCGPDLLQGDWSPVLKAFLEAFRTGDPVLLIVALDAGRAGGPTLQDLCGQARPFLDHAAVKGAAPEVVFLDSPEDLLVTLRRCGRIQCLSGQPGVEQTLTGAQGLRLAAVMRERLIDP